MKAFFAKYIYLLIWIGAIAAIGALFIWVVQANSHLVPLTPTASPVAPPPPPVPSAEITVQTSTSGNSVYVQWENLPDGTTRLNIFRGKTGTNSSTWELWRSVTLTPDQLAGGSATIDFGGSTDGYSFYFQATGDNGSSTWQSGFVGPEEPTPTSTPQSTGGGTGSGDQNNSSSSNSNTPPPAPAPPTPAPTPTPTPASTTPPPTPTGVPYYNPQIQVETYGQGQQGNFWVQHVDQKIQIGWQNLPADVNNMVIYRSSNQDGPWTTVLAQKNPGVTGSYSIQVVDNTLGAPYYYEMYANDGSTTVATYGPIYLAPGGQ